MSMIMYLTTASDATIAELSRNPDRIMDWLYSDQCDEASASEDKIQLDLDKAWHAVHFLLTGNAEGGSGPEAFMLEGGSTIGDVDVGYGPARAFSAEEVRVISKRLAQISPEAMRQKFDHAALQAADIYPTIWDRMESEDVDYVVNNYDSMLQHLKTAASKNLGLIVSLS